MRGKEMKMYGERDQREIKRDQRVRDQRVRERKR